MHAITFDRHGPADQVLSIRDVPKPTPAFGEVLVRIIAAPVNPSDLQYIQGNYGLKPPTFPATPGFEGVGVVEASGGGFLGLIHKGKRVAVVGDRGTWGEYTVTSARQVIPIPSDLPDDQAAAFFVNPATALAITRRVLKVPPGEWLLQSAAGSALGKMVIRLGNLHGFRTMNVVRRREQIDELKKLGADAVIVEEDGPIPVQVAKIVGDNGVRYAMDPVGGATGTGVVQSLSPGGRAVLFGSLSGEPVSLDPRFLITGSRSVTGFWLTNWAKQQRVLTMLKLFRQIRSLMRTGVIQTEIAASYPLSRAADAVKHAATPGKSGKVLLKIGEPSDLHRD
jgi:NADPH:quinone reductase-like Zn-dependent oxidoreductase